MAQRDTSIDTRFLTCFLAFLLAGSFVNAWSSLGWAAPQDALGLTPAYKVCLRASMGVTFLVLSFALSRRKAMSAKHSLLLFGGCAVLALVSRGILAVTGHAWVLMALSMLTGIGFASYLQFSLGVFLRFGPRLFLLLILLTAGIGNLISIGIAEVGPDAYLPSAILLPLLSGIVIAGASPFLEGGDLPQGGAGDAVGFARLEGRAFWCHACAILLCCFASSLASPMDSLDARITTCITAFVTIALAAPLLTAKLPRNDILFSSIVLFTCVCTVLTFLFPQFPLWARAFEHTGFWLLVLYGLVWFSYQGNATKGGLSVTALAGLGALYLISALADGVSPMFDEQTVPILTLGLLVVALIVVLLGGGAGAIANKQATDGSKSQDAGETDFSSPGGNHEAVFDSLAERYGLTPSERDMLNCLSKGYSLKRATELMTISESTAKYYRHTLYQKLGVTSRQDLINLVEVTSAEGPASRA